MKPFCPPTLLFVATMFCLAGVLASAAAPANAWQTAHGDPANSNSVDVRTAPAKQPAASVLLRDIAPGVAPVIAPNGTLYIGNERGKLMSFSPDGTPGWSRDLGGFQSIAASPAIGNTATEFRSPLAGDGTRCSTATSTRTGSIRPPPATAARYTARASE